MKHSRASTPASSPSLSKPNGILSKGRASPDRCGPLRAKGGLKLRSMPLLSMNAGRRLRPAPAVPVRRAGTDQGGVQGLPRRPQRPTTDGEFSKGVFRVGGDWCRGSRVTIFECVQESHRTRCEFVGTMDRITRRLDTRPRCESGVGLLLGRRAARGRRRLPARPLHRALPQRPRRQVPGLFHAVHNTARHRREDKSPPSPMANQGRLTRVLLKGEKRQQLEGGGHDRPF